MWVIAINEIWIYIIAAYILGIATILLLAWYWSRQDKPTNPKLEQKGHKQQLDRIKSIKKTTGGIKDV